MPFSTYLREPDQHTGRTPPPPPPQQQQQQQQPQYPTQQWIYADSAGQQYANYGYHPLPPSSFKAHAHAYAYQSSNDTSTASASLDHHLSSSSSSIEPPSMAQTTKSHVPLAPTSSAAQYRTAGSTGSGGNDNLTDGIFQLPAFLMGNFTGTLAPGGGAEVLTPGALGTFDFAGYVPPPPAPFLPTTYGASASASAGKTSWQPIKYYTLAKDDDEYDVDRPQSTSTTTTTTTAPLVAAGHAPAATAAESASSTSTSDATSDPAHGSAPAASSSSSASASSPFGYLNAESPRLSKNTNASSNTNTQVLSTGLVEAISLPHPTSSSNPDDPSSSSAMETNKINGSFDATSHTPRPATSSAVGIYAPAPSAGLPVYSQSGFDMLSILARVARRPNPTIYLGPVDLTCSFVVADVRRADAPIVYASRTFYELTGYIESEVLGRNCRFLQAPGGRVSRADLRRFTSPEAVRELRFALDKDREVQVSLINYRKDGRAFVNRVSIVPIPAEDGASEIAFHVGFQVDLNEQPALIAQRMQDGKFYSAGSYADALYKSQQTPAERSARAMGKKLRELLANEEFQAAVQLSPVSGNITSSSANNNTETDSVTASKSAASAPAAGKPDARDERQWLQLLLLEHIPDFVHVLSLKGHFLYVSPGITRTLGYAPAELVGKSVGDFCHPSDAVPLLRELKESVGQVATTTVAGGGGAGTGSGTASGENAEDGGDGPESQSAQAQARSTTTVMATTMTTAGGGGGQTGQRPVNLLFRMRNKAGDYTWIESIGRMHVEGGKGRKGVVLSGRVCAMPDLRWGAVSEAGGLAAAGSASTSPASSAMYGEGTNSGEGASRAQSCGEQEFWAMICDNGLFLVASTGVRDLLGWGTAEMIGRSIRESVVIDDVGGGGQQLQQQRQDHASATASPEQVLTALRRAYHGECGTQSLNCRMKKRDGEVVWMHVVLYANESRTDSGRVIVQFKLLTASASSVAVTFPSPTTPYQSDSPATYANPASTYSFSFAQQQHHQHGSAQTPHRTSYAYNDTNNNNSQHLNLPFNFNLSGRGASTTAGRILHAPSTKVFAEFETHRGTSWQYELQQLKYANDKLREQVDVLEARQRLRGLAPTPASAPAPASVYHPVQPPHHQQEDQQQQSQSQSQMHQMHSNPHHRPQSRIWVQA